MTGKSKIRNPKIDPQEGDRIWSNDGKKFIFVDRVTATDVYFRVVRQPGGGLLAASRVALTHWRKALIGY